MRFSIAMIPFAFQCKSIHENKTRRKKKKRNHARIHSFFWSAKKKNGTFDVESLKWNHFRNEIMCIFFRKNGNKTDAKLKEQQQYLTAFFRRSFYGIVNIHSIIQMNNNTAPPFICPFCEWKEIVPFYIIISFLFSRLAVRVLFFVWHDLFFFNFFLHFERASTRVFCKCVHLCEIVFAVQWFGTFTINIRTTYTCFQLSRVIAFVFRFVLKRSRSFRSLFRSYLPFDFIIHSEGYGMVQSIRKWPHHNPHINHPFLAVYNDFFFDLWILEPSRMELTFVPFKLLL